MSDGLCRVTFVQEMPIDPTRAMLAVPKSTYVFRNQVKLSFKYGVVINGDGCQQTFFLIERIPTFPQGIVVGGLQKNTGTFNKSNNPTNRNHRPEDSTTICAMSLKQYNQYS